MTGDGDRRRADTLLERAAAGEAVTSVWVPSRQLAFGRRDRRREGYDRAVTAARERGFPPTERRVGGRAVALDGTTTVALLSGGPRTSASIAERYETALERLESALASLGVQTERGEPAGAFCPGGCSLSVADGKVAGLAQRVTAEATLVGGVVVVANGEELAAVLEAVYGHLEVPFDPSTLGSVAGAGGPADPTAVVEAIERAFA